MQGKLRRTNRDRSATTTTSLVEAARRLFVVSGYAETGTPELAAAASVTRGALYHHFVDKKDLFRAVVEAESQAVAAEIERAAPASGDPIADLLAGGAAFLAAMRVPGRTRLLLIDAPSVLGRVALDAIDAAQAGRTLAEGLEAAMAAGAIRTLPVAELAAILGAAFDRAALAIEAGADPEDCAEVIRALIEGLRP